MERSLLSFFLNLEKRNKVSRTISHLKDADDHDIYDQDQIQKDVLNFYRQLYRCHDAFLRNEDLHEKFSDKIVKLSTDQSSDLEGPLTYEEITGVLRNMKKNKSPGSDGSSVEFFKCIWDDIGLFLLRSLNYIKTV